MPTIAIIGALEKEVAQIKEELNGARVAQEAGLTVVNGELDGLSVVATTAGMGTVNAAAATSANAGVETNSSSPGADSAMSAVSVSR